MIYLVNTQEAQNMLVPRVTSVREDGELTITLENTLDHQKIIMTSSDLGVHPLYYQLAVVLPAGATAGEYKYSLTRGNEELSGGLLFIKAADAEVEQYEKPIEYEQYKN